MFPLLWNKLYNHECLYRKREPVITSNIRFPENLKGPEDNYFNTNILSVANKGIVFDDSVPYNYNKSTNTGSLFKLTSLNDYQCADMRLKEVLIHLLPHREYDIKNFMQYREYRFIIRHNHFAAIYKLPVTYKLNWNIIISALPSYKGFIKKIYVLLIYFLPFPIHRIAYKLFRKLINIMQS